MLPILTDEFLLAPELCYLNHGSLGVTPKSIWEAVHMLNIESENNPIHFYDRERVLRFDKVRSDLAKFLDAELDSLMVLPNATYGVNIVLKSLVFESGDEILISDQEYGAYNRIWDEFKERDGCKINYAKLPTKGSSESEVLDSVLNALTDKTKLVFISHITSSTGICVPVDELCRQARSRGILTVIDGAHMPGQGPLSMREIDADCYIGNCHKWMFAPRSAGFISVKKELQEKLKPLIVSWGPELRPEEYFPLVDEYSWLGTVNWSNLFAISSGIDFYERNNIREVSGECRKLASACSEELLQIPGIDPVFSDWQECGLQLFSVRLPIPEDLALATYQFFALDNNIELQTGPLEGQVRMRVCINCYNSQQDIDRLLECTKAAIKKFGNKN